MKLNEIIIETFSLSTNAEINEAHGPGDIQGWDSLGHVNLMNALERIYAISLDMEDMISIENVSDIKTLLTNKGISEF